MIEADPIFQVFFRAECELIAAGWNSQETQNFSAPQLVRRYDELRRIRAMDDLRALRIACASQDQRAAQKLYNELAGQARGEQLHQQESATSRTPLCQEDFDRMMRES